LDATQIHRRRTFFCIKARTYYKDKLNGKCKHTNYARYGECVLPIQKNTKYKDRKSIQDMGERTKTGFRFNSKEMD
jgi:hypothetical protein